MANPLTELSTLEELLAPAEAELPAIDYKGSLDWIDSLNSRPPILTVSKSDVITARDAFAISNALPDNVEELMALPQDNRRFNFNEQYDPGELSPGSSKLVDLTPMDEGWNEEHKRFIKISKEPKKIWKEGYGQGYPPNRRPPKNFSKGLGGNSSFWFRRPDRLELCLKRKIRREVMNAMGYTGMFYPIRRVSPFFGIRC